MKVFLHHIYEYKKGLRKLVLCTMNSSMLPEIEHKLHKNEIDYYIQYVNETKINVFFGASACVETIRKFGDKRLNQFSPEEDFILGIMLGYDLNAQCDRYLKRSHTKEKALIEQKLAKVS